MTAVALRWVAASAGWTLALCLGCGAPRDSDSAAHDAGVSDVASGCFAADSDAMASVHKPLQEPPPNAVGGFAIDLGDPSIQGTMLQPGQELFPCLVFPMGIHGSSNLVGGGVMTPSPGVHHGNITTGPSDGKPGIHPCPGQSWTVDNSTQQALDVLNGGAVLFGSTTQIQVPEWESFPCGMAYAVKPGFQIVANMHYLNPASTAVQPKPRYQWYTIDPKALKQQLYPFAWKLTTFSLPPRTQQTVTGSCALPSAMHVVNVLPHMHHLGTGLDLSYLGGPLDGQPFLSSPGYDPSGTLQVQYTPSIDLGQGRGFTMSCSWNNTTDQTIVQGTGINEMCIVFGYAWPQPATYTALFSAGDTSQCVATVASN
jgi:hypothetical protein